MAWSIYCSIIIFKTNIETQKSAYHRTSGSIDSGLGGSRPIFIKISYLSSFLFFDIFFTLSWQILLFEEFLSLNSSKTQKK